MNNRVATLSLCSVLVASASSAEPFTGARTPLVGRDNHLAFLRSHEDDWAIVVAQRNEGDAAVIPRPNWVDVDTELTAILGDGAVERTAEGWTVRSGTSGFTIFVSMIAT